MSLWTPIDFRVRARIFGPLVAKNWPKIGVSATFHENCRLDSFHPWDLYLWGKSLDPYRFSCSCPHFWPSGGQKLTENRGFRNFTQKLSARFISSLGFILMGWVSGPLSIFVFVPSVLALWWPKIDRKSGFPQLFAKTVGSIHFIPGIYTYGVSLWTPIDFRVRALIFGPLVAKNWPKIGVSATFRENCRLDSFHPWDLYLWGKSLDPYRFSCSCPHFWPSGGQKLTENRGFRNFSRKLSARFISSLGFILMG